MYMYIYIYIIYIYYCFETTNQLLPRLNFLSWELSQVVPDLRDSSFPAEVSCRYQVSDLGKIWEESSRPSGCGPMVKMYIPGNIYMGVS